MAVEPVFVVSMVVLKSQLRMTDSGTSDAAAILDQATKEVRLGLYQELGSALVATILAIGVEVDNPTTDDQRTRALASVVEVDWVRLKAICVLPVMFIDGGSNVRESWNDEGMTRRAFDREVNGEKERLQAKVDQGLALLKGEADTLLTGGVSSVTWEPDVIPPAPFETLWSTDT